MNQVTRNLACEWAKDNIRVNTVAPGFTKTDMLGSFSTLGATQPQPNPRGTRPRPTLYEIFPMPLELHQSELLVEIYAQNTEGYSERQGTPHEYAILVHAIWFAILGEDGIQVDLLILSSISLQI
ncbi:hypothetical protein F8388_011001, partial [Cannabis sativa]